MSGSSLRLTCPACGGTGRRPDDEVTTECTTCPNRSGVVTLDLDTIRSTILRRPGVLYAARRPSFRTVYGAELTWRLATYFTTDTEGIPPALAFLAVNAHGPVNEHTRAVTGWCTDLAADIAGEIRTARALTAGAAPLTTPSVPERRHSARQPARRSVDRCDPLIDLVTARCPLLGPDQVRQR